MLLLFSHVGNVRGRPVVYKRLGERAATPSNATRPLYSNSVPRSMSRKRDKLLYNQGAKILGDKLKCNITHDKLIKILSIMFY